MRAVTGQLEVLLFAAGAVGVALDAHYTFGVQLQELDDFQHNTVGRVFQLRFTGVEQYIAEGHHQTTVGLRGGQCYDLFFQPFALLLHAEQLRFTQGQLQALTLQLKFGCALLIEHLIGMLAGDFAVALAQVGVVHNIGTAAPIGRQAIGTSQGLTSADHVFRRDAQHVGVFLDLLKVGAGFLQSGFAVLTGAAVQADATDEDQATYNFRLEAHWASPSCLRRRTMRVLSTFTCS
ncbi:hypothetical protein D3C72_1316320 [compost metagenome]